jgi:hypothetical protein
MLGLFLSLILKKNGDKMNLHKSLNLGTIYSQTMEKLAVWEKGRPIPGFDSTKWRCDRDGNWIHWDEYGNRNSAFGWELDHIWPKSLGGPDSLCNYQPLQWAANVQKSNHTGLGSLQPSPILKSPSYLEHGFMKFLADRNSTSLNFGKIN